MKKQLFEDKLFKDKNKMLAAATLNINVENKCMLCTKNHDMKICYKTVEEKENILHKEARYFLCFQRFHLVNFIFFILCNIFFYWHSSLICEESQEKKKKKQN